MRKAGRWTDPDLSDSGSDDELEELEISEVLEDGYHWIRMKN